MVKRSPGPEWVAFQEPAPSSTTSEDELEDSSQHGEEAYPILKRKGGASISLPTPKRPKPSQASDSNQDVTRRFVSQSLVVDSQRSGMPSTSKGTTIAGSSRPRASLPSTDVGSSSPVSSKSSILKVRAPGMSAARTKIVRRKSKGKEREEMDDSTVSPPTSPSPPPTRPPRTHTAQAGLKISAAKDGLPQSSKHAKHLAKPAGPSNLKSKPTDSPMEVIEISSDDADQPPPKKPPAKPTHSTKTSNSSQGNRPSTSKTSVDHGPPSSVRINPRRSLPAPKARAKPEVIEISDDDDDVPGPSARANTSRSSLPQPSQIKPLPLPKPPSQVKPVKLPTKAPAVRSEKSTSIPTDSSSSASKTVRYVATKTSIAHSQALSSHSSNASGSLTSTKGGSSSMSAARGPLVDDDVMVVDKNVVTVPIPSSSSGSNKASESFQSRAANFTPASRQSMPRPLPPVTPISKASASSGVVLSQPTTAPPLLLPKEVAPKPSLPGRKLPPTPLSQEASSSTSALTKNEPATPSRPPLPHARRSSGMDLSGLKEVLDASAPEHAGPSTAATLPLKAKASSPEKALASVIMQAAEANKPRPDPVDRHGSSMQDAIDLTGDDSDEVGGLDEAVASSEFLRSLLSAGNLTHVPSPNVAQESGKTRRASTRPIEQSRAGTDELALQSRGDSLATPPILEHRPPSPKRIPPSPQRPPPATPTAASSLPLASPRISLPGRTPKNPPTFGNAGPASQSTGSVSKKPLPLPSPTKRRPTLTEPQAASPPAQEEESLSARAQTANKSGSVSASSSEGSSSVPESSPEPPSAFVVRLAHRSARKTGKTTRRSHLIISSLSSPPPSAEPHLSPPLPLSPIPRPALPGRALAGIPKLAAPLQSSRPHDEAPMRFTVAHHHQDIEQASLLIGNAALEAAPPSLAELFEPPSSSGEPMPTRNAKDDISMDEEDDDDILEYIDEPAPRPTIEADSDSEMDVENMLTSSLPESRASPMPEDEAEQISDIPRAISAASSTPDPLGGSIPSAADLIDRPRRSTRSSGSASDEPLDFFPEDGFVETPVESAAPSPSPPLDGSVPIPISMFGGYASLNWKVYRQDLGNFKPKCYFSNDLPHSLQDTINSWSEEARRHPSLVHVLQSAIQENTADDEPDAPLIDIINDVDCDPTPPWEFHYTNQMWHSKGVPPPDVSTLTSCGCMGKCDPKSKTCACLKRQQRYTGDVIPDFAYDNRGRLKTSDYPIFECNDLCGCGDECRNRVVQLGRKCAVSIQKTEEKGWGVFAGPKKIYQGSFIGIYAGELLTDSEGEERGIKYNKFGRTYLFDLDFHHLKEGDENWEVKYVVDAYHAGNFTRFLNHSCDPNCQLVPCYINESNIQKPLLTVFARRDIEPFEEICFSYYGDQEADDEQPENDEQRSSSPSENDKINEAVYAKCACKAKNCRGFMFK